MSNTLTAPVPVRTRSKRRKGFRNPLAVAAAVVLFLFVLAGLFGSLLIPYDGVNTSVTDRLLPPGARLSGGGVALLGTDQLGRDMLAQIVAGSRVSLTVAFATIAIAGAVGLVLGVTSGFFGGRWDAFISRLGDIQLAFPSILLAILLAGVLGPSLINVILALAITRWVIFARVVRASALSTRSLDFVDSARVVGASNTRILLKYIIPSCWQPLIVAATVQVGLTMVAEASLSFLGLGVPLSDASWGATIANGRDHLASAWWIATLPGLALALVVVCVGIIGDAFRDRSDLLKNG